MQFSLKGLQEYRGYTRGNLGVPPYYSILFPINNGVGNI